MKRALGRVVPRGRTGAAVITALFLIVLAISARTFLQPITDLRVYRVGGQALLDGMPLYDARDSNGLAFTYTPFAALLFVPAALLSFSAAMVAANVVAGAALVRSAWIVARLACGTKVSGLVVAAIVGVALLTDPVGWTISVGQVNLLVMWLVLEDLAGAVPARFRGVLIGVATGLKLTPALFIVYFLAARRYADAARACAVAALTLAVGFAVQPGQAYDYWIGIAYDDTRIGAPAFAGNQSIHGAVERLLGPDAPALVWIGIALVVAVVGLAAAVELGRHGEQLLAITAVAFTMLLVSPISWNHHWVWLVLLLAIIATPGRSVAVRVWLGAAIVVFASRCIWFAPYRNGAEYDVHGLAVVTQNAYVVVGLALLAWLTTVAARVRKEHSDDGVPDPSW